MPLRVEVITHPVPTLKWRESRPHYRVKPNSVVNISVIREGGPSIPLKIFLKINGEWLEGPPGSHKGVELGTSTDRSHEFRSWEDGSPFTIESLLRHHPHGGKEAEILIVAYPQFPGGIRGIKRIFYKSEYPFKLTMSVV